MQAHENDRRVGAINGEIKSEIVFLNHGSPPKKRPKRLYIEDDEIRQNILIDVYVENIEQTESHLKLVCKEVKTGNLLNVRLEGMWAHLSCQRKRRLRIVSPIRLPNKELVVNNEQGIVIIESHELIPCTTVSQAVFCRRKAVISQRFRGCNQANESMLIGSLVHSLFQAAVRMKPRCLTGSWLLGFWKRELRELYLNQLVALGLDCSAVEERLSPYITSIVNWLKKYMPSPLGRNEPLTDGAIITDIIDIEDNLWDPDIGIKGKVDVSLRVKTKDQGVINEPLELKTGKSKDSIEHYGQVMLYCFSLSAKKLDLDSVGSGTLLYLLDGTTKRVRPKVNELKGILHLRNELAAVLSEISGNSFPSPISNAKVCTQCEHAVTCFALQKVFNKTNNDLCSLENLTKIITCHLSTGDLEYFKKWVRWTFLEWNAGSLLRCNLKDIWELSIDQREKKCNCIGGLKAVCITGTSSKLTIRFVIEKGENLPLIFSHGDMVILSSNRRTAFGLGFVSSINESYIDVDAEISKSNFDSSLNYFLDRYDSNSIYPLNLGNVAVLMQNTPHARKLRSLLIDLKEPVFTKLHKDDVLQIAPLIKPLNREQGFAILKSLTAKDYVVIEGFPGSGKTSTVIVLIRCLVRLGRTVLIASFTHSAIDNLLLKLLKDVNSNQILRLGSASAVRPELRCLTLDGKLSQASGSDERFNLAKKILLETPIVACTCLEVASNVLFSFRRFSLALVDEASQSLESTVIAPIATSDAFVLVGDSSQLAPLVQSREARKEGMAVSLLERLKQLTKATVTLRYQYRMNKRIVELSSKLFYEGKMVCGNDAVANGYLDLPRENSNCLITKKYLLLSISCLPEDAVVFIDTVSTKSQSFQFVHGSTRNVCYNEGELKLVKELCETFLSMGISESDIGIVCVYRNQKEKLRKVVHHSIEVNTVDQYQGRDKALIIISFVWTQNDDHRSELLADYRRINVALTRAKNKLILIGCRSSLKSFPTLAALIDMIPDRNIVVADDVS